MITKNSTLAEVYRHPVGKDLIDMALRIAKKDARLVENPLTGKMKLSMLSTLLGGKGEYVADLILHLLNMHPETPPPSPDTITRKWWKEAVVYQIYPRSFQDSNGDGIGDLNGIKQRIPYLKELGVDVVWLSPIYDSPNDDNGYDIRDYRKIMKEFGTMAQFQSLLDTLHKNGIRLIMDLVVNHSSDEHEWFQKALKNPDGPTNDYYIWAKGSEDGGPPNNWGSFFAESAWNYYPERDEWGLHLFSKKQMDLNWDNPALRAEVYDMVNWWLKKGVDGFRLDVINLISKDSLENGNETIGNAFGFHGIEHYFYGPRLHEYLQEMRREAFGKYDVFTVGETPGMGMEMCKMLTSEERGELDLVFNFDAVDNPGESRMKPYEYDLRCLRDYFADWQQNYGNNRWQSLFFENHDNPRMTSKVNPTLEYAPYIAKLLGLLQMTLKGTPFVYQGQELGMTNTVFHDIAELRDVETLNRYHGLLQTLPAQEAFESVAYGSRDHARTPMQWTSGENAGFTDVTPWLDVNPNHEAINAEAQLQDENSVFAFYKKVIALRHAAPALVYGEFNQVFPSEKSVFCYFRILDGEKYYIEINLTDKARRRPGPLSAQHILAAGNYGGTADTLRPYEANVYKVQAED